MDKKKIYVIIGIILLIIVGVIIWYFGFAKKTDAEKFKAEYESLNGTLNSSGTEKYQTLDISADNKMVYSSMEEVIEIMENKGTALVYFGFPNCPWCRGMVPVLLDALDCSCLEKALYVDMTDLRDTYELKDGKAVKTKDASDEYYKLLDLMDVILEAYTLTDEDDETIEVGEKRIYVPLVVAIKDGNIVSYHADTVDLDEDQSPYDALTDTQKSELKDIFVGMIDDLTKESNACEDHC